MIDGVLTCVSAGGARTSAALSAWLSADRRDLAREDTINWIKRLRLVRYGDESMRQRFTYHGDSLWWFTELYLHKMRRLDIAVATLHALDAACEDHAPTRLEVQTSDATVALAARAFGVRRGIPLDVDSVAPRSAPARWKGFLVGATAHLSRLRPIRMHRPAAGTKVAAFVHTAFWRPSASADQPGQEQYVGPVLQALAQRTGTHELTCVGVGPRRHFRARRWWDPIVGAGSAPRILPIEQLAPRRALRDALDFWGRRDELARALVAGPEIRSAGIVQGCDLWPVLCQELEQTARVQWPWSVRAMDEAGAAIQTLAPRVVVTYAEAGGWGRALMLEARRRAVPSVGLQHGFIYRHWLNYRHVSDEQQPDGPDRGFPRPDRTLLFDGYAGTYLQDAGRFPAESLLVTGSPRLDEFAQRVQALAPERDRVRDGLGVAEGDRLLVVASKFTEIRDELPALFDAMLALPGAHVIVKAHPADDPGDYQRMAANQPRIRVATGDADLGRLLAAADAVVTMNSTVALDAMALGVPGMVVGLPNNLSPFVDAGVLLGGAKETLRAGLETLLYDRDAREALRHRAAGFAAAHDMRADGLAAERAADAILALASA